MTISESIRYIGVNDHRIDLFEGQYRVPNGMAYNSYLIMDEKVAVMDTVDVHFTQEWLGKLEQELGGRKPDYLVVQHMEPDHSASILDFLCAYPEATVVSNRQAFAMMGQYFDLPAGMKKQEVKNGESLELGKHVLTFVFAPMVHWPEVMVTYDSADKVLFSADGFGKFGALDVEEPWDDEARRYYIGIVGKYGQQVQRLLQAAAKLDIRKICPLHGPVLTEDLGHYLGLYDKWSSYTPESSGVLIAYTSVYGHTKEAAELLYQTLKDKGCTDLRLMDLARSDMAEAVAEAFRVKNIVLATTTYNAEIYPFMREFITHLTERGFCKRNIALIENGTWAPQAAKLMRDMLSESKELTFLDPVVTIKSAMKEETRKAVEELAAVLFEKSRGQDIQAAEPGQQGTKRFVCRVCGYIYEGEAIPEGFQCPLCRQGAENFQPVG